VDYAAKHLGADDYDVSFGAEKVSAIVSDGIYPACERYIISVI